MPRSANPETNLITQDDLAKMNQEDEEREEEKLDGEESLDSVEVSVEDLRTDDQIYGQYEQINRPKKGHSCMFRDLILHINNTDYVVKQMKGEITHSNYNP